MSSPRTISSLLHRSRRTCIHAITNHPTWMREGQAEPESPAPSNGRVAYRGSPCPTDRMGSPRARASRPAMLPKVRDSRVGPSGFGTGEKVEGNRRHSLVGCSVPRSIRPASRTATGPSRYCVPRAGGSRSPRCSSPMAPTGARPCGWHRPLATKTAYQKRLQVVAAPGSHGLCRTQARFCYAVQRMFAAATAWASCPCR